MCRRPSWLPFVAFALVASCKSGTSSPQDASTALDAPASVEGGALPDADGDAPRPVTRAAVLDALGNCALTTLRSFVLKASALEGAASALVAAPGPASVDAARAAYKDAMAAWQVVEGMVFGPTAAVTEPGGQDGRDNIYSWPLVNRCAVEEVIVARGWEKPGFSDDLVIRRGLAPLEYLLFYEGADTACPATSVIVSSGSWAALSVEERAARKRAYAAAAAADVRKRAEALVAAWQPFVAVLASAGAAGNTLFPRDQDGLNAAAMALLWIDNGVKDLKLRDPLGLGTCTNNPCPEAVESPFAGVSRTNIQANLSAFRSLFQGCGPGFAGPGFDDLLPDAVAQRMLQALAAADTAAAAIEETNLATALVQDRPSVDALYAAVKALADLLKMDVFMMLNIESPNGRPTDND